MGSSISQKTKQSKQTTSTHAKATSLSATKDSNGQIQNQTTKNTSNLIANPETKNDPYLVPFDSNQSKINITKNMDSNNAKSNNNNTTLKGQTNVSKTTKQLQQQYPNNEPHMAGYNPIQNLQNQLNFPFVEQLSPSQQMSYQESSFRQAQSQYDSDPDSNPIQRQETAEFQLRKIDTLRSSMQNQLLQSQMIFIPSKASSIQLSSSDKISLQSKLSYTALQHPTETKPPQKSMVSFGGSFHNKLEVASAEDCDLVKFDLLNLLEQNNNQNQSPSSLKQQESPQVANSSPQLSQSQQQQQQRELFQARKSRKQKESLVLTSEGTGIWGNPQYNNGGTFLDGSTQDIFGASTPLSSAQGQIQLSKNTPYLTVLERKLQAAQERRIKHIQENLRSDTDLLEVARMQMALLQAQKEAASIEGGASPTFPLNSRCDDSIEIEDDYNFSPISQKQSQQFTLNTFGEFNFNSMPCFDKNNTNENKRASVSSTTPMNNRKSLNKQNIQLNGNITPASNHNNNNNNNNDIQSFQSESSDSQQGNDNNNNNNINNLPYDIFGSSISPRGSINLCNLPASLPPKYETFPINSNNNVLTTQSSGNSVGIGQYEEPNQAVSLLRKSSKRQNSVRFMLPFINLEKIRESDEKEEDGATKFGESNREVSPFSNKLHHPNSPEVLSIYNPAISAVTRSIKKNDSLISSPRSRQNSSIRTSIFDPSQKNISSNKQIVDVQLQNANNNNNSMLLSLQNQKNKQTNNNNADQQSIQIATQTSQSSMSEEEEGGVLIKDILQGSHQEETDEEGQSHEQHFRFSDFNTLPSPHLNLGNYPRNSIFFVNNNDKLILETGYKNSQDSSFEDKHANDQSFIGNRSSLNLDIMRNNQRNSTNFDGNHLGNNEKQANQLNNSSIQSPLPSSQQQLSQPSQPSQPSSSNQILMKSRTSYNRMDDTDKENPKSSANLLIPNQRPSHSKTVYHSPSPSPTSANNFNKRNSINPNHSILSNNSYITFFNKNPDSSVIETSYVKKDVDEEGKKKINSYTLLKELGRGGFGKVKLASSELHVASGETVKQFAIKISNKKKLKYKLVSQKVNAFTLLEREVAIMKKIDHPHLVKLYEVIDDPEDEKIYMVMEYMQKGSIMSHTYWKKELQETDPELFKKIFEDEEETNMILSKKKKDLFPKKIGLDKCRKYFQQFALAIDYMHNYAQVIHRDIKPENILINEEDNLKIGDFGVSHIMESHIDSDMKDNAGTKAFTAPEGWNKQFKGKPLDMWAAGVTLYNMAFGELPFFSKDQIQLRNLIVEQEPVIPAGSDPLLVDLILKLLKKDPEQRITAEEMLLHPWLTQNGQIQLRNSEMNDFKVSDWEVQGAFTKKIQISTLMKVKIKLNRQLSRARSFLQSAGLDNSGMSQDKNSMEDKNNIIASNNNNNNQFSHGNSLKI